MSRPAPLGVEAAPNVRGGGTPAAKQSIPHAPNIAAETIAPRRSIDVHEITTLYTAHHQTLFRDRVFTDADWKVHHSWRRYLPEPNITVRVIWVLTPPLCWIVLVAVLCGVYQEVRTSEMPSLDNVNLVFTYSLCTFAVSLLLVFKTNASYARWVEARVTWGAVYTRLRNIVRKVMHYAPDMPLPARKMFVRWAIAMPYIMRSHLLSYAEGSLVLSPLLTAQEREWLETQPHKPLAAAQMMVTLVSRVVKNPYYVTNLDNEVGEWVNNVGACERLSRTPIPTAYSRHTVRFLICFLSCLPVALWPVLHWWTVIVSPVVAFLMMGIENIGIQIENPLLVLPMAAYCSTIFSNIIGMTEAWVSSDGQELETLVSSVLEQAAPSWQDDGAVERQPETRASLAMAAAAGVELMSSVVQGSVRDPLPDMPLGALFGASPQTSMILRHPSDGGERNSRHGLMIDV